MPIEKSAGAIIFRKEEGKIYYLLLYYELRHWDFPKGHIEKEETIDEAARREIKEETGIEDIHFVKGFKEWFKYFYKKDEKNVMKILTLLLAETKQKKVKLSYEHIGFKWLVYEEALGQLTFDNAKQILRKANNFTLQRKFVNKKR